MKLIIFDFDGTLADTRQLIVNTMQQTIQALETGSSHRRPMCIDDWPPFETSFYRPDSDD